MNCYKIVLLCFSMLIPFLSQAEGSLFFSSGYLGTVLKEKSEHLNITIDRCNSLKQRTYAQRFEIKEKWYESLNRQEQKHVLSQLNRLADERCTKSANDAYSAAVVEYTANTGDQAPLEQWLKTKKQYVTESDVKVLQSLPLNKVQELSESDMFYYPFNLIEASKKLSLY